MATNDAPVASELLDSWKEIAAYLKRDESTVRRWEEEGLPVHRRAHKKQASVYAYKSEIDAWWQHESHAKETNESATQRARTPRWIAATVIVLLLVALGLIPRFRRVREEPIEQITQITTLPGLEDTPSWSPDGRMIAFTSDVDGRLQIYLQRVGAGQPVRWSVSEHNEAQPAWSPDGERIAFVEDRGSRTARGSTSNPLSFLSDAGMNHWCRWHPLFSGRNGDVWVRPVRGGQPRLIAEDAYFPAWSPDGRTLVYVASRKNRWGLWSQSVDAPDPPRFISSDARSESQWLLAHPAWSPDGKWIAFTGSGGDVLRIFVIPSNGGAATPLTGGDAHALMPNWSRDGRWLFFSSNRGGALNLWKARFENVALATPHQVTVGSENNLYCRPGPRDDTIAYSTVQLEADLWEFDRESGRAVRLTTETAIEDNASPSPDGSMMAFASNRLGGNHLWLLNRRTGELKQVSSTSNPVHQRYSFWSPDSRFLFYWTKTAGRGYAVSRYDVAAAKSAKIGEADVVCYLCLCGENKRFATGSETDLKRTELSLSTALLERMPADVIEFATCSPDCRWVVGQTMRARDRDLWMAPLNAGRARHLTSGTVEDAHPVWSPDSRWVYFVRDHRDVYAVPVGGGDVTRVTRYNSPNVVIDYPAVSGDGKKIFFTRIVKTGDIYLIKNAS